MIGTAAAPAAETRQKKRRSRAAEATATRGETTVWKKEKMKKAAARIIGSAESVG